LKPFVRITDGPDNLSLEIGHTSDIIDDGEVRDVVKEAVDRNVPAQGIFFGRPETFRPDDVTLFCLDLFELGVTSKSGDFDHLSVFEKNVDQSKSTADRPAVPEEFVDLVGMGIGDNIEVFRDFAQEEITDTSPHEIGQKTISVKTVKNLQGLFIDSLSRYGMLLPGNDQRGYFQRAIAFGESTQIYPARWGKIISFPGNF